MGKIVIFIFTLSLFSCEYIRNKEEKHLLAKVGDEELYKNEVYAAIPESMSSKDSTRLIKQYIDSWIREQVMLSEIYESYSFDEQAIENQLKELRNQLITHQYRSQIVKSKLTNTVSRADKLAYYEDHKEDFQLRVSIVKGLFAKIPIEAPHSEDVYNTITTMGKEERVEFKNYCYQFAVNYHVNDSLWIPLTHLIESTPLEDKIVSEVQFLRNRKAMIAKDSLFEYVIQIDDYKVEKDISPLEFVDASITSIILNQRKKELIKKNEEDVYLEALKNKTFQVYYP
ncbi:MAG: hypothetical protein AB8B61_05870 [Cyclobacteriaceae bacterium]